MSATTPTLDSELYNFATMRIEERARGRITDAIDTDGLAGWFGAQLRHAYQSGLKDGYVQGRHDRHKEASKADGPNGVEPALHGENGPDSRDAT